MSDDRVTFKSGATSSKGHDAPYWLTTGCGSKRGALRFGAGNVKHENSDTVLANANWLKAFHDRDLAFFRNRYVHAMDHAFNEMQGRTDSDPGGNWGAVAWFLDVICFVEENDLQFYNAVQGLIPHPGPRSTPCRCPRCQVPAWVQTEQGITTKPLRAHDYTVTPPAPPCPVCADTDSFCRMCYKCDGCCKCL